MPQVIQITSRQFRERQKDYFELADQGVQIILKRGNKKSYLLTPVSDEDLELSPELKMKIDKGVQDIKEGKTTSYSLDQLRDLMGL